MTQGHGYFLRYLLFKKPKKIRGLSSVSEHDVPNDLISDKLCLNFLFS